MSDGIAHQFSTAEWDSHLFLSIVLLKLFLVLDKTAKKHWGKKGRMKIPSVNTCKWKNIAQADHAVCMWFICLK